MPDQRAVNRLWPITAAVFAAVASAPLAPAVAAIPGCAIGALQTLNVPGLDITAGTDVPATAGAPEYCSVTGFLNTAGLGAGPGSAGFEFRLPLNWNGKFLFFGVGGLAGSTYADFSANPVDLAQALTKGYATAITDEGHQAGGTDAAWSLIRPGVADGPKVTDYYYRATHEVTVAGKQLVRAYYGAASIKKSYFDGCSNGGRQAMIEASDFPTDYDGIISGAPFFDIRVIIHSTKLYKALLKSNQTYIPATLLPQIDAAVYAACDAADGAKDGLIQNPAACNIDPRKLVCPANQSTATCVPGLTTGMADTLKTHLSETTDQSGNFVYNGYSITDLSGGGGFDLWGTGFLNPPPNGFNVAEPWGNNGFSPAPISWQFSDHIQKDIVTRDPTYNQLTFPVSVGGIVQNEALALFDSHTNLGSARDPASYVPYLASGRKLIIYHGFSDPALTPYRTTRLYEQFARLAGSYSTLQSAARLFMVPGMQHCGGGPGPNSFDTLTALENWVEHNIAPEAIPASHYIANNRLANPNPDRTMPLCKFPEQARYVSGAINVASSWTCSPNDRSLLQSGLDGTLAGTTDFPRPFAREEERAHHNTDEEHD